ncbi:unnamed protein product [Mytilus coruscus]|uniref:Uncharacterized protein n=1 Tax=Mytilus coruscus TaxID=42192 RepID=A0A6J8EG30_MYTCO|nr:unnamed protein product [Mytilus coruscus]
MILKELFHNFTKKIRAVQYDFCFVNNRQVHTHLSTSLNDRIPNPCPEVLSSPVADMCMASIEIEKDGNGYDYLDSVVLRAMINRGGCTCDILIENHIIKTKIFIEKYKNMSAAAPENNVCGLAMDIEMLNDESVSNPIECTNGVDRRQFSIVKNGVLRFTSRIIPGNFTQGYCMHIIRDKVTNTLPQRLKIVCNESEAFRHESSIINPTEFKQETNGKMTKPCLLLLEYVCRRSNKRLEELQRNNVSDSNQENEDPQYDGLKYNVLYVTATQQQDIDINYSTVDVEGSHTAVRHSEIDNHYNTVESNAETSSLQTLQIFHDNKAIINNETPKSSNETKNPSPPNECSVVYAVVDKRLRNPIQNSCTKIQDDANPEQANAIVDKTRNQYP